MTSGASMKRKSIGELRVMCIDDDPFSIDTLTVALGNIGVTDIKSIDNAKSALEVIGSQSDGTDVILLDIHMPDVDGIEFIQALGANGYQGAVAVVSGAVDVILDMSKVLAIGRGITFLGTIKKPAKASELEALLNKLIVS
jgi:CheY-like chemotaxis protein